MQYGETTTRTFEVRNEGLFDFKYAICDFNNEDEKNKIRVERNKEAEERLLGLKKEEVVIYTYVIASRSQSILGNLRRVRQLRKVCVNV